MNLKNSHERLTAFLQSQHEWLLIDADGNSFALNRNEIEVSQNGGDLYLSFIDKSGFQVWTVDEYHQNEGECVVDLERGLDGERRRVRFVPRVLAEDLGGSVELARLEQANEIASLLVRDHPHSRLIRISLNKDNGRFAQIIFEQKGRVKAALTDVSATVPPELLLSNAIRWLEELRKRRHKNPINEIWILAETKLSGNLQKIHALLRDDWKRRIRILSRKKGQGVVRVFDEKPTLSIKDLWRSKPTVLKISENNGLSLTAGEVLKLAPREIDHIFSKQGETLRYRGLPFARVRKMAEEEKCWFGIEREKRLLSEGNQADFEKLIDELEVYRRFDSDYRRHEFYRLAPESWLESILRRNIKLLDANLILSPIFNQFRSAGDRIDLLAIRRDGRLVIIELKVSPDREMIYQAIDYWRKIELQRRKGVLRKARLFGDLQISDTPALVYLVAPTLSYHRDFRFFARTVSKEVEIYRFDLAENWRECVKVLRREKV